MDPNRPRSAYKLHDIDQLLGFPGSRLFTEDILLSAIRAIFSLKNLRRAPGSEGRLASFDFEKPNHSTSTRVFLDDNGATTTWPGQLLVVYGGCENSAARVVKSIKFHALGGSRNLN